MSNLIVFHRRQSKKGHLNTCVSPGRWFHLYEEQLGSCKKNWRNTLGKNLGLPQTNQQLSESLCSLSIKVCGRFAANPFRPCRFTVNTMTHSAVDCSREVLNLHPTCFSLLEASSFYSDARPIQIC